VVVPFDAGPCRLSGVDVGAICCRPAL